ncbi:MAG: 3'-5' exonuclease, partial [Cyanobacteria bacterium J06649_11]
LFLNPSEAKQKTDAVIIHGLLPDSDQRQYHEESEVLASFLEYLGNSVMVAHHLHFDVTMVNQSLARCGAGPLLNQGVDTAHLARRLQPSGYWSPNDVYTLDAQARRYKIPLADRHTAVGDSYITAVLFMKQIQKLEEIKNRKLILEDLL